MARSDLDYVCLPLRDNDLSRTAGYFGRRTQSHQTLLIDRNPTKVESDA